MVAVARGHVAKAGQVTMATLVRLAIGLVALATAQVGPAAFRPDLVAAVAAHDIPVMAVPGRVVAFTVDMRPAALAVGTLGLAVLAGGLALATGLVVALAVSLAVAVPRVATVGRVVTTPALETSPTVVGLAARALRP